MKYVKLKILCIIWISILLVFAVSIGTVNLLVPYHFEKEARNALIYEMQYIDKVKNGDEESLKEEEYYGTFFSGNIRFIDFYDEGYSVSDALEKKNESNSSEQNAEIEIREHYNIDDMKEGTIQTLHTEKGYYVLVKYYDAFTLDGTYQSTVMYINIQPVVNYVRSLNWIFAVVFLAVVIVMSLIGYKLGKRIELDQETSRNFFQNSSHELKTPLMAIQGYAEGIKEGIVDSSKAEIIIHESEKMANMIDGMLSISKIDANQLTLHFTTSDLREILYDCLRTVEPIQQKKGITITPLFTENPVWIHCDEMQLSRVFTNVIINGIRHCNSAVVVSCKIDGKNAVVKVSDDGDGIAEEDLPHIFDRFYSGTNGNTGIGLALSKEIVNLHKGSITAHNEIGAIFEIKLPIS